MQISIVAFTTCFGMTPILFGPSVSIGCARDYAIGIFMIEGWKQFSPCLNGMASSKTN